MSKQILYGNPAKQAIKNGIDAVADAVKVTLGPKGQNVFIDSDYEEGKVTKDGVSVARSIQLENKLDDAGAKIIKKVAEKTADGAGDGTTTATVIAQALVNEGQKLLATGVNPMDFKKGIQLGVQMATESFKNHALPVGGAEDLIKVATVSANGDNFIGGIIGDAINTVGPDGVVTIDTSKDFNTYIEKVQGLRFDRGFVSPYFQTDPSKGECVLENPYILITSQKITTIRQLENLLNPIAQEGKPLFIVCDGVDGEALGFLVVNNVRGTLKSCVVKCPSFGDRKDAEMEDMAILVGATVVNPSINGSVENANPAVLGTCDKVVVTQKYTTIIGGKGDESKINNRIVDLKHKIDEETSKYNKDILKQRLAKLNNGVAILFVGALTEMELNEKKDRIDDALCASRAANEEGILPGGGIAYLNAALEIEESIKGSEFNTDQVAGLKVFAEALKTPIKQIIENGYGPGKGEVAVSELTRIKSDNEHYNIGINAVSNEQVDMITEGILDPAKVCRTAVENAGSIAAMFLTTGAIVIDKDEPKKQDQK